MFHTLEKYILESQSPRSMGERVRIWLHDERVFARLLAISFVLHIVFYVGIILLNSWEMRNIKPLRGQAEPEIITQITVPRPPSRLRTPTVAIDRADVNRFEFDPEEANDDDLIARSPNPSTQRGSNGVRPASGETGNSVRPASGTNSPGNSPSATSPQPPVVASVPNARTTQPAAPTPATPAPTPPAPPAPRPAPNNSPDAATGTQRGTNSESTAFSTQRVSAQYIAYVRGKVRRTNEQYMPRGFVETTLGREASAEFSMTLNRSGSIISLILMRSSGYKALDDTARQAIFNASPFEGYPQTAGDTIPLTVTVYYSPSR